MPINLHNITMDYKMELFTLFLCVLPAFVISITITPNGNSPEIKMVGGMTMDVQSDFVPMESKVEETTVRASRGKRRRSNNNNSTKLSINERYRRLIPYMTFYYANDLAIPTTDNIKEVEVEKAEIVETDLDHANNREPKKIIYSNRNIPRYQGNRLTQHNIASANPTKVYYKGGVPIYQTQGKVSQNYNPLLSEYSVPVHNDYDNGRLVHKQVPKSPGITFVSATRKPYLNLYNEDSPNVRYYTSEKPKYKLVPYEQYKLVPYEQTPPVKVSQNENVYDITKKPIPVPVSVILPKEQVYLKPRPARPHYVNVEVQQANIRKQPTIVSESYYEKQRPQLSLAQPVIQSGFRPIFKVPQYSDDASIYTTSLPEREHSDFEHQKEQSHLQSEPMNYEEFKPHYYQHVVDQTPYKLPPQTKTNSRPIPLASLLNTLQLNKSIPKPITKENVGSSIRTLLQVLNVLKSVEPESQVINPIVLSTPKPFVAEKVLTKPAVVAQPDPNRQAHVVPDDELTAEPYLAPINPPSQYLDDITPGGGTSQHFPLVQASDDEGGTPGRPGVDYPILTTIPPTSFDCKTQRYKGFFADTETRCQVWHYCDLNGGQASFLCPNGTIFSQAGLTCDWWFNVQCASTTQLYVLNESLYKYILPHSPKFPEDYSGPLVDKYLTLKFKEMEEEFKKNKNKQSASEKADSDEEESDDSDESSTEKEDSSEQKDTDTSKEKEAESAVNAASVLVGSPGESGKVERLQDD